MPPHLVMQAWEKYSIQQVSKAGFGARIGAIERKWPGFPAKPDHGAPFLHYRVLFGHEHGNFSIQTTTSINASPAHRQNQRTLSEVFFTYEICHSRQIPAETSVLRNESFTGLERSN